MRHFGWFSYTVLLSFFASFLISSPLFFKKKFVVVYLPIRHLFLGGNFFDADVQNCPIFKALKLLLKSNKNRRAKKKNCKTWKLQPLIWVALKRNKRNCNVAFPLPSCGKDRRNLLKISSKIFDIFSKIKSLDSNQFLLLQNTHWGRSMLFVQKFNKYLNYENNWKV